ncbi:sporulation YhaL family protein [Halobacillus sp. Marseille-P3879]|uniref:sporulation YhaL family protein n=1 Tax=Halobacillus TaxID=45667 RepID=UPI000C7E4C7F|nr:sporulation YhaL family protein [Halobacillus sp. Marseille-P3879]
MIVGLPVWVFFCIILIFVSGIMAYRAMRAEQKLEQQFIEKEGKVYLNRMEEEKQQREKQKVDSNVRQRAR